MLEPFVTRFVLPLLGGGEVLVDRPVRPRERTAMQEDAGDLGRPELRFVRLRRAQELTPDPDLPDPDLEELQLWVGLHNALVFDHPDRGRVWARGSTWRRAEGTVRSLLTLPMPTELGDGLARHLSVGAFLELVRDDVVVATAGGDVRFLGQQPPRRRLGFGGVARTGGRAERVQWLGQPHAPETERLVEDAMRASPLTCLLHPLRAPPGWSPLWAVGFLQSRAYARAVCHVWARHKDWVSVGGAVMGALLPALPRRGAPRGRGVEAPASAAAGAQDGPLALPGATVPTGPEALGPVVGALVHLHFLKVLELDARLGLALGSRDPGILSFLALPLLLPWLQTVTGTPLGSFAPATPFETGVGRRWTEYVDHLEELVPRRVVENLLATLVPEIVKGSSA